MAGCLDDNGFAALVDGRLGADERQGALAHINCCPACFETWLRMAPDVEDPALCETPLAVGGGPELPIAEVEEGPSILGHTLAGFVVQRELGRGAMGVVYEAVHPQIRQRAAVKVLFPAYSSDPQYLRRFLLEARTASAITHPGLVTMFNYGRLPEGATYLMMEYLEGESLYARLARRPPGPVEALRHARHIAAAMAAVHAHAIVHRDLKPANVMLIPDAEVPGGERTKVVDFGLARFSLAESVRRAPGMTSLSAGTARSAFVGTVAYASPEQCSQEHPVEAPADVYSLGIMMYEMLAGRRPFQGRIPEVMAKHVAAAPPPLREGAPETPAAVGALVHQMLAKAPSDRPTMAQVRDRIDKVLAGQRRPAFTAWVVAALLLGATALGLGARWVRGAGGPPPGRAAAPAAQ